MAGVSIESVFDLLAEVVLLAVDAVQVDVVQDPGAVPGAGGDLGGRAGGVQPQGQGGMPEVIRAAGERGSEQYIFLLLDSSSCSLPRSPAARMTSGMPPSGLNATGAPAEVAARAGNSARVLHDVYLHCIDSQQDHLSQQIEDALDADASHRPSSQRVKASGYTDRRLHRGPCPLYVREPVPGPAHSPRPPGPQDRGASFRHQR